MVDKRRVIMFGGLSLVVIGMSVFLFWDGLVANIVSTKQVWDYKQAERKYVKAMTEDTYGGETPQETLNLFVDALKKEDVELASKYFILDEHASREHWVKTLQIFKDQGLLGSIVKDLEKDTREDVLNRVNENDYKFDVYDKNGNVGAIIDMRLNTYSKVWKIESL